MKLRAPASTHKKVVVSLMDRKSMRGYLNPTRLGQINPLDLLTPDGEHEQIPLERIRSLYFVREFSGDFEPERKSFLSRPKLDGLWIRLRYTDGETLEGVVPNDLLSLLDNGVQFTPPDLNSNTDRIFVPRSAITQLTVLGVVGIARRKPAVALPAQPKLFSE
ncbi:MAG TPA: hypothetical protein VNX66_10430 [Candidatus Sulfotelmatobacter sp.]|nr:hypothetical protein [Candidatus Sulfotelmatobacter sp.]